MAEQEKPKPKKLRFWWTKAAKEYYRDHDKRLSDAQKTDLPS